MTEHNPDTLPIRASRGDITIGLLLCELFGAMFLILFIFFPPARTSHLAWSLNITFLIPVISMWAIVFCVWLIARGEYIVAAYAVVLGSIASSLYGLYLLYHFHDLWMVGVILPERSLSVVLGVALGAVLLRMAIVATSSLRPSFILRGSLVITSICVMIAGGYAAYVTPAMLASNYRMWDLPRRDISRMTNTHGPAMPLRSLDGSTYQLDQDRGKVVLMNFWATWCGPCVDELPHLQKLFERMDPERTRLLAVCIDEDTTGVRRFVDSLQLTFPVLWGTRQFLGEYGIQVVPTNLIIDRSGVIRKVKLGFAGEDDIRDVEEGMNDLVVDRSQ